MKQANGISEERTTKRRSPFLPLGGGVEGMNAAHGTIIKADGVMVYVPESHLLPRGDGTYNVTRR